MRNLTGDISSLGLVFWTGTRIICKNLYNSYFGCQMRSLFQSLFLWKPRYKMKICKCKSLFSTKTIPMRKVLCAWLNSLLVKIEIEKFSLIANFTSIDTRPWLHFQKMQASDTQIPCKMIQKVEILHGKFVNFSTSQNKLNQNFF